MNELIKRPTPTGEIVIRDPFDELATYTLAEINALLKSARERVETHKAALAALGDIETADIAAVRELRKKIEADDETLKDYEGEIPNALVDISGLRPLLTQIHGASRRIDALSLRGQLRALADTLKTREDAAKPPEASVRQLMLIDATPSAWKAIDRVLSAAKKDGTLKSAVRVAVTNPKHIDAAAKVIHEVEAEQAKAEAAMGNV